MEHQKQKIAEFLDGIIDSSLPAEQQIMLFSEDEGVEGTGFLVSENGGCTNKALTCGGSINNECKNFDSNCNDTTNRVKCEALNGLSCAKPNFSTATCGGQGGDS